MSPVRVFVIDDSSVVRHILCRVIERSFSCTLVGSASSVESARGQIAVTLPDVITLDLVMPGCDGLGYLDETRERRPAIVVVSAATQTGSPETLRALAHGADACFDKGRIVSHAGLFIRTLAVAARSHVDRVPVRLRA
ncbi:response regulator [Sphingomonas sp. CGMCC 1.13654]|uniref:Response regulator n=1 Tax=Sphingomonas chungangi TaxID=2683589 RepID=A0A838L4L8_9SPHN|nr:response regulator [Sphingomonas chungangi]MBA2934104.1 response regulator [Sphingomonas chungangi]MVW57145.1 response regulator [Sphingomonas chungangi]